MFAALAFHRVTDSSESPFDVSWAAFRSHLDALADGGWTVEGVRELGERLKSGGSLPERYVLITFDDGFDSDLAVGRELTKRGFRGTFSVVTSWIGEEGHLTPEQVRELAQEHEVASHTTTHKIMRELGKEHIAREIEESREAIQTLSGAPCMTLSLPGGAGGRLAHQLARQAGYSFVGTSRPAYNHPRLAARLRRVDRVCVMAGDTTERVLRYASCDPLAIARALSRYPLVALGRRFIPASVLVPLRRRFGSLQGTAKPTQI